MKADKETTTRKFKYQYQKFKTEMKQVLNWYYKIYNT